MKIVEYIRATVLRRRPGPGAARALMIAGLATAEVLALLALRDDLGRALRAHWRATYGLEVFARQLAAGLLPVPPAFLLWVRALERDGRLALRFSPARAAASGACLAAVPLAAGHPSAMLAAAAAAVVALFASVPPAAFLRRAGRRPRLAAVALAAAASASAYYWLMRQPVTDRLLAWDAAAAGELLNRCGVATFVSENLGHWMVYNLYSAHYTIALAPYCCGFEGVFLGGFLVSAVLLLDWDRFRGRRLWPLYVLGALGMLGINVLRVAGLFALGTWASAPGAPAWARSLRGAPLELFHSWLGWILDLVAFACAAAWLYRSGPATPGPGPSGGTPGEGR